MREKTAAVVIIGNEILTGKTEDQNASYLTHELHGLGVALRRISTIPDDEEEIAATVRDCAAKFDYVFTSGGVGPTHDDVTIVGIAKAFGRGIMRHPGLVAVIHDYFGSRVDEARLRMADAPEGSELIYSATTRWPVMAIENVYILPGVPEIFRAKFAAIRERFRATPFHTAVVFTREDEFDIASRLNQVAAMNPRVAVGSYPNFESEDYRVKITVEANEAEAVERARALLIKLLNPALVVRTE
ncbi:MAG: competence/damage-inducible protein A [Acidobacteriia bacterium]|nr:competence/damage-inducible protein A [Terriglobia bacterium]